MCRTSTNNASNPEACPTTGPLVKRAEGQAATGITDVDLAYSLTGVVWDWWSGLLGRDSVDGAGMTLVSTVRYCESPSAIDCPMQGASGTAHNSSSVRAGRAPTT